MAQFRVEFVLDEQNRPAIGPQSVHQREHLLAGPGVQVGGRLVQENDGRVHRQD